MISFDSKDLSMRHKERQWIVTLGSKYLKRRDFSLKLGRNRFDAALKSKGFGEKYIYSNYEEPEGLSCTDVSLGILVCWQEKDLVTLIRQTKLGNRASRRRHYSTCDRMTWRLTTRRYMSVNADLWWSVM